MDLKAQFCPNSRRGDARGHRPIVRHHISFWANTCAALVGRVAAICGRSPANRVSSGTTPVWLALMALGIGAGDEVITSPFTFFRNGGNDRPHARCPYFAISTPWGTFNFVARLQCKPSFTTVWRKRGLIISPTGGRIKALMPVHLYVIRLYVPVDAIAAAASIEGPSKTPAGHRHGSTRTCSAPARLATLGAFRSFPSKNGCVRRCRLV